MMANATRNREAERVARREVLPPPGHGSVLTAVRTNAVVRSARTREAANVGRGTPTLQGL